MSGLADVGPKTVLGSSGSWPPIQSSWSALAAPCAQHNVAPRLPPDSPAGAQHQQGCLRNHHARTSSVHAEGRPRWHPITGAPICCCSCHRQDDLDQQGQRHHTPPRKAACGQSMRLQVCACATPQAHQNPKHRHWACAPRYQYDMLVQVGHQALHAVKQNPKTQHT
jgi:hypothetical protein